MIGQCPCDKHLQVAAAAAVVAGFQYSGYLWNHLISVGYCFRHLTAEKAIEIDVSAAAVAVVVAEADDAAGSELVPAAFAVALVAWGPYWAGDKPACMGAEEAFSAPKLTCLLLM